MKLVLIILIAVIRKTWIILINFLQFNLLENEKYVNSNFLVLDIIRLRYIDTYDQNEIDR